MKNFDYAVWESANGHMIEVPLCTEWERRRVVADRLYKYSSLLLNKSNALIKNEKKGTSYLH